MNNLKRYLLILLGLAFFTACDGDSDPDPLQNSIRFELFQSSDFEYNGVLEVTELKDGNLQLDISLDGAQASGISFPAHLHFGAYDAPVAEIAFLLNPISGTSLQSSTLLGTLADGEKLTFDDFKSFDGHIKIHLAADGPDYETILVSGNVGMNYTAGVGFDVSKITVCSPE